MSTRPILYPVTSIDPIREALGSRDASLIDRIREAYIRVEEERFREDELEQEPLAEDEYADEQGPWEIDEEELRALTKLAKAFVNGKFTRKREPGVWRQVLVPLAHALGLTGTIRPSLGDWTTHAWRGYLGRVSSSLPDGPRKSLEELVEGRSLTGREIEHDGCSYAWLTSGEVSELLLALRELPESLLRAPAPHAPSTADLLTAIGGGAERDPETTDEGWLPEFHRAFVECLSACEGKGLLLAG